MDNNTSRLTALSLWQPFASLMAVGAKRNETRGPRFTLAFRGDLVVCAAKHQDADCEACLARTEFQTALAGMPHRYTEWRDLPLGAALCVVEVWLATRVDLAMPQAARDTLTTREQVFGDYSPGRTVLLTRNLRRLRRPVPVVGRQGLWRLTEAESAAVRGAMP